MDLFSPNLVFEYPRMSDPARNNLNAISQRLWIRNYFAWLNGVADSFPADVQRDLQSRIVSPDPSGYYSAISEIVFAAIWKRLGWSFEIHPNIRGKTPDFRVCYDQNSNDFFLSDITILRHNHPHHNTMIEADGKITVDGQPADKLPLITEPIDQAHRVIMEVDNKCRKYVQSDLKMPFACGLMLFDFPDRFYIDDSQFRNALYGDLTLIFPKGGDFFKPSLTKGNRGQDQQRGIFAFEENSGLAAVLACYQNIVPQDGNMDEYSVRYEISIYPNPLGCWATSDKNPFILVGLSSDTYLPEEESIRLSKPRIIRFY